MSHQEHVNAARARKVEALAAWLVAKAISAEVAAAMDQVLWADVAKLAGVRAPSLASQMMVLGRLQQIATAAAMAAEQPHDQYCNCVPCKAAWGEA